MKHLLFKRNHSHTQQGVALVIALILLVLVTLVGLAAMRGTITQQQMTSDFYDRETSFQSGEAALRAASASVASNPTAATIRDCTSLTAAACWANPFNDPNLPGGSIISVTAGTGLSFFTVSALATGQPQYVVENMGQYAPPNSNPGALLTANSQQENNSVGSGGINPNGQSNTYFRITARSGNPATVGDRSVVTLQILLKQ